MDQVGTPSSRQVCVDTLTNSTVNPRPRLEKLVDQPVMELACVISRTKTLRWDFPYRKNLALPKSQQQTRKLRPPAKKVGDIGDSESRN